jgi:hypothetical protein
MVKMHIGAVKQYETNFILFLLNGVADENKDIALGCEQFLEEHGARMRDAL